MKGGAGRRRNRRPDLIMKKIWIEGQWTDTPEHLEVRSPYDGSLIDTISYADATYVERAVNSARRGAEQMRRLSAARRSEILLNTARIMQRRFDEFALTLTKEVGKPLRESQNEVGRAIQTITIAAEEAKRIYGQTVPFDATADAENKRGYYMRVPVGVVLAITPFNAPLNLAAHKVAPALAAGNAVILKPASATPLADTMLVEALLEAGLPPEGINLVVGSGSSVGDALVAHPAVNMVTFTGSPEVGEHIMHIAGLKKVTMELGSSSCVIAMDDADIDAVARKVRTAGYANAGQVCISVQRVIVHESMYDKFIDKLVPLVGAMKIGDPLDESVDMGPMITEAEARRVEQWIQEAVAAGARCMIPVKRSGALLSPTVLADVTPGMKVWDKEVFGPLVAVAPCRDMEHAVELANSTPYGLQAGVFTNRLDDVWRAIEGIDVGGIMINEAPSFRIDAMPYGGVKLSGIGREGPRYVVEEMTEMKLVCFDIGGGRKP